MYHSALCSPRSHDLMHMLEMMLEILEVKIFLLYDILCFD